MKYNFGHIEVSRRKYDGKFLLWTYRPSQENAMPWICLGVFNSFEKAKNCVQNSK